MKQDWAELWEEAKQLEKLTSSLKKEYFDELKKKFQNEITQKSWGILRKQISQGKLNTDICEFFLPKDEKIQQMEKRAKELRLQSVELLKIKNSEDNRPCLDPKTQVVPVGKYKKLKQCKSYPLRDDCNHGENENSKWKRCEYFKYDETQSILSEKRWKCIESS